MAKNEKEREGRYRGEGKRDNGWKIVDGNVF